MSSDKTVNQKVAGGVFWLTLERICAQLVSFCVSIVLARILIPDDYGLIALITVFINILNVFITGGFSTSLLQKKDADDLDYSSVMWFTLIFSILLYALLYFAAPIINLFYNYKLLTAVMRAMGLQVIIAGIKSVFTARLTKEMKFKKFFWATFIGTCISAVISIYMAYHGFGVWALVAQYLINNTIDTIILGFVSHCNIKLQISFKRLKSLISYGWKVLAASLIDTIYNNIRTLIIGIKYSSSDLAFYNRGKQFPDMIINNISGPISSAVFPALSSKQDVKEEVKALTRTTMKMTSYLVMPVMFGLAIVAEPLVHLVLTDKWLPCVPFLQILCFNGALMPLQSANVQAVLAMGRSDINVKLNVLKKSVGLAIVLISSQISVLAMAYAGMLIGVICLIINMFPNNKLFGYSIKEQLLDILPYVLMSFVMSAAIWWIQYMNISSLLQIVLQVISGGAIYIALSLIFKVDCFKTLIGYFKKIIIDRKRS